MSLLDLFRNSRLRVTTPDGRKPGTYEESAVKARNIRFPPTLSPEASFDNYVKLGINGALPIPAPPITYYLMAENDDFLVTESDDNLIADQDT